MREIRRRPWLSHIEDDGRVRLERIPPHDTLWPPYSEIAANLVSLLCEEALDVCRERNEIYLLLSGGLDSRIIAGVVAKLYREGRLQSKPIALTWGLEKSRDVVYARAVADLLNFHWEHIAIVPEDVAQNIEATALLLGCLVAPEHLHRMTWFKNVSRGALVLAGSYGDSVGRAEFSGRHVLELDGLHPANFLGLLSPEVAALASEGVLADITALHDRAPGQPGYVVLEHEMHGQYMRGMIAHAMSIINHYCTVYQMFTHPKVYAYMWSIHPARRTDYIYEEALEQLDKRLARLPWARTNRALRGRTMGARAGLLPNFAEYAAWTSGPLFKKLQAYIDPEWFAETCLFDPNRIRELSHLVQGAVGSHWIYGYRPHQIWVWLACFRRFAEWVDQGGKSVNSDFSAPPNAPAGIASVPCDQRSKIRRFFSGVRVLHRIVQRVRRHVLRRLAVRKYPPRQS
ncbi:hypothetical protein CLG94_12395 [Candidatus Methylomirabilis limnetica]|uniref:Asparagine synthetase domain-containing protein n=1 Tax=Candidatus Methylomirabilis limnetica TaxID=2033718 RepID=A0A2T4TUZ6_9BACT|nr:asparagine synthase-related protein [Candidatus Methylomirabilis limnetica]PTL34931.1 hypothetical protein CLG94_12395 [Candidatus Methylomirabilis limnetica]